MADEQNVLSALSEIKAGIKGILNQIDVIDKRLSLIEQRLNHSAKQKLSDTEGSVSEEAPETGFIHSKDVS